MLKIASEHKINSVYLMLGQQCNFRCKYCIQCEMKENIDSLHLSRRAREYIWHLIRIRPECEPKLRLVFWGGEPLLYFKLIQELVSEFKDTVSYWTVSNGSLLTQEIVDYFNLHKIGMSLSYDGINTKITRGIDITEKEGFLELFNSLKLRAIDSVISAYNCDYMSLFENCKAKFGDIYIACEFLNVTWDMPKNLYSFDLNKYRNSLKIAGLVAYRDIIEGRISNYTKLFVPTLERICSLSDTETFNFIPNCNRYYSSLSMDLIGNIYGCHNCNNIVSNVSEDRINGEKKYQMWVRERFNPVCCDCEFLRLCKGSCPLGLNTNNGKYMCQAYKLFYQTCIDLAKNLNNYSEPVDFEV